MERLHQSLGGLSGIPFFRLPTISDEGVVLGFSTMLFRRSASITDPFCEIDRVLCLLSVVGDGSSSASWVDGLTRALRCWDAGEKSLAHIHLAQMGLGSVEHPADAWRLLLADALIEEGMEPRTLASELGLNLPPQDVRKFDPNQPRNPAGSGQESGQWTKEPAGAEAFAPKVPVALAPSVVDSLAPEALDWIAGLASSLALPVAVFGLAMVYTPTTGPVQSQGAVPGHPDLQYRLDPDTGRLTLSTVGDADPTNAPVAQLGPDGIYRDILTGVAIARAVGDHAVLIDPDRAAPDADADVEDDQPKLCPAPKPDQPGGRKVFDILYEQYVRNTVNPQRQPQLPPQLTFALPGDTASGWVHFDDCRESDGTMIDAKGNYEEFASTPFGEDQLKEA